MLTLSTEIKKHIKTLVHPLKSEEALLALLKIKLTKKELKLLKAWSQNQDANTVQALLHLDEAQYALLSTKLIKKLNQEKLKQVLCI
ncbi:MAG: hypothetical protein Q9M36_06620 [Sulfurovum sp.]|nr:hypothetical protein [Sulfurovum sp.]